MIPPALLVTLALLSATAPFATDMYLPVMPAIAAEFGVSASAVQLTLTGFFLGMASGQLFAGPLSDALGRRQLLLWGAAVALVASVLAAAAGGIGMLVVARGLQGLGGGMCVVLARAIVPDLAHGDAATRAFSLLMAMGTVAPIIAPIAGGLLAGPVGWRGIYLALAALHALQLVLAWALVPATGGGVRDGGLVRTLLAGYAAVLRQPVMWGFVLAMSFAFATLFSFIAASSFVIQEVYGFGPLAYSLLFAVNAAGLLAGNLLNARVGRALPMLRAGTIVMVLAAACVLAAVLADAAPALVLFCVFFATAPCSLVMGNTMALATGRMRQRAGAVSAVLGCAQSLMAGAVSPLVGLGADRELSMAVGLTACSVVAAAGAWWATAARRSAA